jgi:hypothetical protein
VAIQDILEEHPDFEENFPRSPVEALRSLGHEVAAVKIEQPGSSNREALERV